MLEALPFAPLDVTRPTSDGVTFEDYLIATFGLSLTDQNIRSPLITFYQKSEADDFGRHISVPTGTIVRPFTHRESYITTQTFDARFYYWQSAWANGKGGLAVLAAQPRDNLTPGDYVQFIETVNMLPLKHSEVAKRSRKVVKEFNLVDVDPSLTWLNCAMIFSTPIGVPRKR